MERLAGVPELLDGPLDDPRALRGNLRDLRRINRLGGRRRPVDPCRRRAGGDRRGQVTLVDVGTGGADIPIALIADATAARPALRVTAVDSRPEVLDAARAERPGIERIAGLSLELGDGTSLPYPDGPSTSPTLRSCSTTSSPARPSRSFASSHGSRGSGSSSTTSREVGSRSSRAPGSSRDR